MKIQGVKLKVSIKLVDQFQINPQKINGPSTIGVDAA